MSELEGRYPKQIELAGERIDLSLMTPDDQDGLLAFSEELSDLDLLFLSRDVKQPKVLSAWMQQVEEGEIISVVARRESRIVGTTAVVIDRLSWSSHVGELRVLVSPAARDIGLGRQLIQESFLIGLDLGLEKLTARMTIDQDAAFKVFEELGFRQEALFQDHVKDREGKKHDLIIMSHDVDRSLAQMEAYGMDKVVDA
jgi:L-amino acid N-acyltransferase YncA